MARFKGVVRQSDLEGGLIQLQGYDGQVFELEGDVGTEWVGRRVVIEGTIDRDALSFGMTGPRLMVRSIVLAE